VGAVTGVYVGCSEILAESWLNFQKLKKQPSQKERLPNTMLILFGDF
jgi:hypothetical protein